MTGADRSAIRSHPACFSQVVGYGVHIDAETPSCRMTPQLGSTSERSRDDEINRKRIGTRQSFILQVCP